MAYTASLTVNQQLAVINQGNQTILSVISSTPGQQQSQNSSFTTGVWQSPPELYQTALGFILQIQSQNGSHYLLIQGNSITTITNPVFKDAKEIDLQQIPDPPTHQNQKINIEFESMPPMSPMSPMQPMKMGNMSMDLNSMSMQMGNMSMNMDRSKTSPSGSTSTKRFCDQCGQEVKINARFCGSCGHKLDD